MPKSRLLSTAEAADALGVNTRTVHRLVTRGELTPALRMPGDTGAYLFDRITVERAAQKRAGERVA